jgi:hypothetical protein
MPEDGDAGPHPHEHLHEVGKDGHEEDRVGGEVLELKTELLQEQKEEGGDRGRQPSGDVRVEEDELPRDEVVEGARACLDLTGELWRGPPQEAAHRVELFLALEVAGMAKRRHGGDSCGCKGKDCKDAGADRKSASGDEGALRRLEKASAKRWPIPAAHAFK